MFVCAQFLLGLSVLPLKQDPFVSRLVRQFFAGFVHLYPVDSSHPVVLALTEDAHANRLRNLFLEVLRTDLCSPKAGQDIVRRNAVISVILLLRCKLRETVIMLFRYT